jgi:hypothetical protein
MESIKTEKEKKHFRIDRFLSESCKNLINLDNKFGCNILSTIIYLICIGTIIFFMKKILVEEEIN